MDAPPSHDAGHDTGQPLATRPPRVPLWATSILRVPLFWKLLLANVVLVAAAGATVALFLDRVHAPVLPVVAGVSVAMVTLAALANAAVVRLALRPVDTLTDTAFRVRNGDMASRVPHSVLADDRLDRLSHTFNDMLDTVSAAQRRQRELARRVLEAEERERERIAHELYSGTAQTLAGVLVRLRILSRQEPEDSPCSRMDEVTTEIRQALEEIRGVARRLRPPELDELGVRAALEAHARRLTESRTLRMEFLGQIPEADLSDGVRLALFRIVQEALTNAARHAGAGHVHTRFFGAADGLVTEIEDDGQGFDQTTLSFAGGAGLGLMGMEERAGYAGGSLTVDSRPGRGTRLRLVLPWAAGDEPPGGDPLSSPPPERMIPAGATG